MARPTVCNWNLHKPLPLSVSVTTLPCSVASVNGAAVEAANDSEPEVTGICAVNAEPP